MAPADDDNDNVLAAWDRKPRKVEPPQNPAVAPVINLWAAPIPSPRLRVEARMARDEQHISEVIGVLLAFAGTAAIIGIAVCIVLDHVLGFDGVLAGRAFGMVFFVAALCLIVTTLIVPFVSSTDSDGTERPSMWADIRGPKRSRAKRNAYRIEQERVSQLRQNLRRQEQTRLAALRKEARREWLGL